MNHISKIINTCSTLFVHFFDVILRLRGETSGNVVSRPLTRGDEFLFYFLNVLQYKLSGAANACDVVKSYEKLTPYFAKSLKFLRRSYPLSL